MAPKPAPATRSERPTFIMASFTVWLKPTDDLYISLKVEAASFAEAIDKGKGADVRKKILAKGVEWIDGGFTVSGVFEDDK